MAPNYRIRVAAVNNTDSNAELDASNFAVVDGDGEVYYDIGWVADLSGPFLADGVVTLRSGESSGGWLYFEVADPSRSLRFEYSPDDIDADLVSTPLGGSQRG